MSKPIRKGDVGAEVMGIQMELKSRWAPDLDLDGKFGPETEKAVRKFQAAVGFKGKDIDGVVGSKTMVALFQTFDMKIFCQLMPKLTMPALPKFTMPTFPKNPLHFSPPPAAVPPKPGAPAKAGDDKPPELPKSWALNWQGGAQYSKRDGPGCQLQLGLTFRSKNYFPNSDKHNFYSGAHLEVMPALVLGIPIPPLSSVFTGQVGVTIQPLTDWLVIRDRWHLLTPSIGFTGQFPINPKDGGTDDTATHARLGGNLGLELFHLDVGDKGISIGISSQLSGYHDFTDQKFHWDPSALGFIQGTFASW